MHLGGTRTDRELGECLFALVDCHRSVGRLVRVDTDHHCHIASSVALLGPAVGMSDSRLSGARASFEPHRGEVQTGGSSLDSQATEVAGRRFESHPVRTSRR